MSLIKRENAEELVGEVEWNEDFYLKKLMCRMPVRHSEMKLSSWLDI